METVYVPGEIRAPGFTDLDEPQRDDLTTNRQGPEVSGLTAYMTHWGKACKYRQENASHAAK